MTTKNKNKTVGRGGGEVNVTALIFTDAMAYPFSSITNGQRGLITRAQLLEVCSKGAARHLLSSHRLTTVRRGVYALPGAALDYETRLMALVLSLGGDAVVSHRSAATVWGLRFHSTGLLEVSASMARNENPSGGLIHQNKGLDVGVTCHRGLPITTAERTLLECARYYGPSTLQRAMEDALITGVCRRDRLVDTLELIRASGRRRIAIWDELLPVDDVIGSESVLELKAIRALRDGGVEGFVQQYPATLASGHRRLDIAFPSQRINLEIDGRAAHEVRFVDDRRRDRELELLGWLVLRFTEEDIPDRLVTDVRTALAARAA